MLWRDLKSYAVKFPTLVEDNEVSSLNNRFCIINSLQFTVRLNVFTRKKRWLQYYIFFDGNDFSV